VADLVDDGSADLLADLVVIGADELDVLLIQDDVVGTGWQVEDALLCGGNSMEKAETEGLRAAMTRRRLAGREVFNEDGDIANALAELRGKGVEGFFDQFSKAFAFHDIEDTPGRQPRTEDWGAKNDRPTSA
jgi:hypothetical protein